MIIATDSLTSVKAKLCPMQFLFNTRIIFTDIKIWLGDIKSLRRKLLHFRVKLGKILCVVEFRI